jgi:transposase-like protein
MALLSLVIEDGTHTPVRWGLAMDDAGFEALLASVVNLTVSQRGRVFLALALSEASEDGQPSASVTADAMASPHLILAGPLADHRDGASPAAAALDPASVTEAARQRVQSAGCPHCASHSLQRWRHVSGLPRYRCKDCRRSFNALTGTPLARLRKKERWAAHAQALMTGESVVNAAKRCDVAVSTAFRCQRPHAISRLNSAGLSRPTRPISGNRSRVSGPICRARRANAAAESKKGVWRQSRSVFWSRVTEAAGRPMRCLPDTTGPRSRPRSPASSRPPINSAVMAESQSLVLPAGPKSPAAFSRNQAAQCLGRPHSISIMSTATMVG